MQTINFGQRTDIVALMKRGFAEYKRKPNTCLARLVNAEFDTVPWVVEHEWGTLIGNPGDVVIWDAEYVDGMWQRMDKPRFNELANFVDNYQALDLPNTFDVISQLSVSIVICYKVASVWAKQVDELTFVVSRESGRHTHLVAGDWLVVDNMAEGLFYGIQNADFLDRYLVETFQDA